MQVAELTDKTTLRARAHEDIQSGAVCSPTGLADRSHAEYVNGESLVDMNRGTSWPNASPSTAIAK